MIALSEVAVRVAAALLPRAARARYREQWLGELRDAPEVGIRPSGIAAGSLAFAATLDRPLPSPRRMTPESVRGRSRLAAGLALGAALVAVTRYADVAGSQGLTGISGYDFVLFAGSTLLSVFGVLAVIASLAMVTWTRATPTRVRVAVWLLSAASASPVAQRFVDGGTDNVIYLYLSPGTAAYLAAIAAVLAAGALLRKEFLPSPSGPASADRRTRIVSALGGTLVLSVAALCMTDAIGIWTARSPLIFGGETDGGLYREWVRLKNEGEYAVNVVFFAWGAFCVAVGVAVAMSGLVRRRTANASIVFLIAALTIVLMTYATVVDFLRLMAGVDPTLPTEPMMLVGRATIIAVSLITVGGLHLARRTDHPTRPSSNRPTRTTPLLGTG